MRLPRQLKAASRALRLVLAATMLLPALAFPSPAFATQVDSVTVALTASDSAGGRGQWRITFSPSAALYDNGDFIVITFPTGTTVPATIPVNAIQAFDGTQASVETDDDDLAFGAEVCTVTAVTTNPTNRTVTIVTNDGTATDCAVAAGAGGIRFQIHQVAGILNPAAGAQTLTITTQNDADAVNGAFLVTAAGQVANTVTTNIGTGAQNLTGDTSAAGAGATYRVGFTATAVTGALAADGSTISVTFPTGTTVPTTIAPIGIRVDENSTCAGANADGATGFTSVADAGGRIVDVKDLVIVNGLVVTFIIPVAIAAAASACVLFAPEAGIRNPTTTSTTLRTNLATSSETTNRQSAQYAVTTATVVTTVTVDAPVPNTSGSPAQYEIQFFASADADTNTGNGGLFETTNVWVATNAEHVRGSTATITFPAGTVLPTTITAANVKVAGNTADCSGGGGLTNDVENDALVVVNTTARTVTFNIPNGEPVAAGQQMCVRFPAAANIRNPAAGNYTVFASTSADTTAVESATYTIAQAPVTQVDGVAVVVANPSAGAASAYTITIDSAGASTGVTSGLTAGTDTVTVTFPSNTTVPATIAAANLTFDADLTCGGSVAVTNPVTNATNRTVTFTVPTGKTVNAQGDAVICFAQAAGIVNPTTAVAYQLTISTSLDTGAESSANYNITAAQAVGFVSVDTAFANFTDNGGAVSAYQIDFQTSPTGDLVTGDDIAITFPAGFTIPTTIARTAVTVDADNDCANGVNPAAAGDVVVSGQMITISVPNGNIGISDDSSVCFTRDAGIVNTTTAGTTYTITMTTSADPGTATSSPFTIAAATAVSFAAGQGVTPANTAPGTQDVVYDFTYTVSSEGGLTIDVDTITITFPSGFVLPTSIPTAEIEVSDESDAVACAAGTALTTPPTVNTTARTVTLTTPRGTTGATADNAMCVHFNTGAGLDNPATGGQFTAKVATSKDVTAATSPAFTIAAAATQLVFSTQPSGAAPNTPFTTQPVVSIADANGNTVPTSGAQVSLAIEPATGTAGAILQCTVNPVTTVNGVASFSGCRIDQAGTGYRLRANTSFDFDTPADGIQADENLTGLSATFNVTAAATAVPPTAVPTSAPLPTATAIPPTPQPVPGAVITANPNPVAASTTGSTTTLSWSAPGQTKVQVWVSRNFGGDILMAEGTATGSAVTGAWINAGNRYDFKLFAGTTHTAQLAQTTVTKNVTSGFIDASPNPAAQDGSTTITWNGFSNSDTAQVWVSRNGGGEVLMSQNPSGATFLNWIRVPNSYVFRLYAGEGHLTGGIIGSVTVSPAVGGLDASADEEESSE